MNSERVKAILSFAVIPTLFIAILVVGWQKIVPPSPEIDNHRKCVKITMKREYVRTAEIVCDPLSPLERDGYGQISCVICAEKQ